MVTVLKAQGLRVVIFLNDHPPPHVHVFGDGQAWIDLLGPDGEPDLAWTDGMSRGEARRALRLVSEEQRHLLARWEKIHGGRDDGDFGPGA